MDHDETRTDRLKNLDPPSVWIYQDYIQEDGTTERTDFGKCSKNTV
jgi:hypothetical protein